MKEKEIEDEEIENSLFERSNRKIRKKMEDLRTDEKFQKKVIDLREKWAPLIKEFNYYLEKLKNSQSTEKLIESIAKKLKNPSSSQEEKDVVDPFIKKMEEIISNSDFEKDIINLTKENKLYPLEHWWSVIRTYVLTNNFYPPDSSFKVGLMEYFSKEEIFNIPNNLNFAIKIEKNKRTKEPELFIQIFENTTLRDLKKNWQLIMKCQKELRGEKGTEKRDYPHKNLEIEKKLIELDSKKMSDWEKQQEIYGEAKGLDFGKIENKRKNRLKKIRQRSKEKMEQ